MIRNKNILKSSAIALSLLLCIQMAQAQESEPLIEQLRETFKRKYLSFGALLQTGGDFQVDRTFAGNNGFGVRNMRLSLSGELDEGFGYFLQGNFVDSPVILDAMLFLRVSPSVVIDIGQFKAPFSQETLTGADALDFINRSQAVTALAPARQIGLQVKGWLRKDLLSVAVGVFNGNGFVSNDNDNDDLLYVARLSFYPLLRNGKNRLETGFNIGLSEDDGIAFPTLLGSYNGSRFLIGGDARLTMASILLSGELILSRLNPTFGPTVTPYGFHATVAYLLGGGKAQILLRWDGFETDGLRDDSHLLILGYNHWPTQATKVQVNYVVATANAAFDHHQLLVNAQIGF